MGTYRAILRSFLTWVLVPAEFPTRHPPASISWLSGSVKMKDKRKLVRGDLLTPSDIQRLLAVAIHPRDKAIISVLWESGGRIAEIGNRRISQVVKHQFGFSLELHGKTGQRSPLLISSAPHLSQWLAVHPYHDDQDAPLWVYNKHTTSQRYVKYQALRTMLRRHLARAGINKRIFPHLFRHSRATHCVATGIMNEPQAKTFFGWSPGSKMLSNYAHLTSQDANNAIMRENNLTPPEEHHDLLAPRQCPSCSVMNLNSAPACVRCNTVLNEAKVRERLADQQGKNAVILQLCQLLVEKGLLDDAARQIHEAGLGNALRTLAQDKDLSSR